MVVIFVNLHPETRGVGRPSYLDNALRLHGMSWVVKTTCFKAPGMSLGGSGVSIGGVRSLRVVFSLV